MDLSRHLYDMARLGVGGLEPNELAGFQTCSAELMGTHEAFALNWDSALLSWLFGSSSKNQTTTQETGRRHVTGGSAHGTRANNGMAVSHSTSAPSCSKPTCNSVACGGLKENAGSIFASPHGHSNDQRRCGPMPSPSASISPNSDPSKRMRRRDLLIRSAGLLAALTFRPNQLSALGGPVLETGRIVPSFDLPGSSRTNPEQNHWTLDDFRGKWLVLYFYPRDFTGGCTIEARGFESKHEDFLSINLKLLESALIVLTITNLFAQ